MNNSEFLLPPLPGCGDLKGTPTNSPTQSSSISERHERPRSCDRYSESVYKGYDAYHSQIRKLDWLKAHQVYTTSAEVSPHATWLIATLHAIIARWEQVLPYIAQPYPRPPNSPPQFTYDAIPEPPPGRENLLVLRECLEARGRAIVGESFMDNVEILADIEIPGFGTRRVVRAFKLHQAKQLAMHACFVRNLVLELKGLEGAFREQGVGFVRGGGEVHAYGNVQGDRDGEQDGDEKMDGDGDVVLGAAPGAMGGGGGLMGLLMWGV